MIVEFLQTASIREIIYSKGDVADIDADDANNYIRRGICKYIGDGARHHSTWTDLVQSAVGVNPAGAVAPPVVDETEAGWPGSLLFSGSADNLICGAVATAPRMARGISS